MSSDQSNGTEPKIMLFMIARNESEIIRRCLDSVQFIIDAICICDNGPADNPHSNDNMVEIIEQTIKEYAIPGKVCSSVWKNFGHNRTISFQEAQNFAKELGWNLEKSYGLTIDGDMMLKIEPDFKKSQLIKDAYLLKQYNGNLVYPNTRIMKLSLPWKSVSVTHEYWAADGKETEEKFEPLWIDDKDDGKFKSDKFQRDIRLLTQGLIDEPDNMRYLFYLAQSYKCLHKYEEAIQWYQKRINAGGWFEEVWYSHFMIACCYKDWSHEEKQKRKNLEKHMKTLEKSLEEVPSEPTKSVKAADGPIGEDESISESDDAEDNEDSIEVQEIDDIEQLKDRMHECEEQEKLLWTQAQDWYLKAYQNNPARAESIYELSKYYREVGDQELGYKFAKWGLSIPYPEKDTLFITPSVYDYELLREIAICGYYTKKHKQEGFEACDELLFDPAVPSHVKDHIAWTEFFYIPKLPYDWVRQIEIDRPYIKDDIQSKEPNKDCIQLKEKLREKLREKHKDRSKTVKDSAKDSAKDSKTEETPATPATPSEPIREKYRGMNPSFIKDTKGYTMIYRTVNFTHNNDTGAYTSLDEDGIVRTRNYLVKLSWTLEVQSQTEIIEPSSDRTKYPAKVVGMEDCRLFKVGQRYWFTCTTCDTRPSCVPQITICRLAKQPNADGKLEVDLFVPLTGLKTLDSNGRDVCEKNWLPFADEDGIKIIYNYEPFTIVTPDVKTGTVKPISQIPAGAPPEIDLSRFRGSTCPISFDKGYLFVIHDVIFEEKKNSDDTKWWKRHYVHRFVWISLNDMAVAKISLPFYFVSKDTEYCSGLAYDYSGKQLMLGCGINDEKAMIFGISEEKVMRMLRSIIVES